MSERETAAATASVRAITCPDAVALESVFRREIRRVASARSSPFAPITVIAPTARLLRRLQVVTARELGAGAAIEFLVHRSVAERVLALADAPTSRVLPSVVFTALADSAARAGDGALARDAARFPSTARAIAATFRDLRDAGIGAEAIPRGDDETLAAYARYSDALDRRASLGEGDAAALFRAATAALSSPSTARVRDALGPVLHVGAVDLTGSVRALLAALARGSELSILALGAGDGPAFAWGRERLAECLEEIGGEIACESAAAGDGLFGARLDAAFAEGEAPSALAKEKIEWIEAPGAEEEIAAACRVALRWTRAGVPLEEIAFVARSLDEHAPLLAPVLAEHALPFVTSATHPAARRPSTRALLDLVETAARGFRRADVMRCLRHDALRGAAFRGDARSIPLDRFDRLSRRYALDGEEAWRSGVEEAAAAREASGEDAEDFAADRAAARALRFAFEALAAAIASVRAARSWSEASNALAQIAGEIEARSEDGEGAASAAARALTSLQGIAEPPGSLADVAFRFRAALESVREPVARGDGAGIRILDLQQARGLVFRGVVLLSFHEGSFPRVASEDALLSDARRGAIEGSARRPVPRKGRALDEERWLFALALGAARERFAVIAQRADARGRARNASPFAREFARLALGSAATSTREEAMRRIPSHPAEQAAEVASHEGLVTARAAVAAAGLLAPRPVLAVARAAKALGARDEALRSGLALVAAVESFRAATPRSLRFDGVGAPAAIERISPSSLERLARCPMQFFLRERLRVRALEQPEAEELLDPREVGNLVHRVLERIDFSAAMAAATNGDVALREWIDESLPPAVDAAFGALRAGRLRRQPVLAAVAQRRWTRELRAFLAEDLAALATRRLASCEPEREFEESLALGSERVVLHGWIDRVVRFADGAVVVGDYKTGAGEVDDLAKPKEIVAARHVQLPLYALAVGARGAPAGIEALRIHPDRKARNARRFVELGAEELREPSEAMRAALGDALALARGGAHPITLHDETCKRCDFRPACRRSHARTRERVGGAAAFAPFFALPGRAE